MKKKVSYLRPVFEIIQAEAVSSFLLTSGGFDQWGKDDDFDFDSQENEEI